MNVYEIDGRIGPLDDVIVGIQAGLKAIRDRTDTDSWFDGFWGLEYSDFLLGLAFVAAQAYVLGAWTDLNHLRECGGRSRLKKHDCYASDTVAVRAGVTRIGLVNAIANYFKHHDEWSDWPANGTTQVLGRVGITKATAFPCVEATRLLCGESWEMTVLAQIVSEWRTHVFSTLR